MRSLSTSETPPPNSPIVAADLQEAAQRYFADLNDVQAIAGHPNLVRIVTPAGQWRVHRWPEGTPLRDLTFSHEVINRARDAGLSVAPEAAMPVIAGNEPVLQM